jgi:hypothetical protein
MAITLEQFIGNVQDDLDDPNGNYLQPASITRWCNDGCYDIAKRAECLLQEDQEPTTGTVGTFIIATTFDIVRIHRLEWTMDNVQVYPLELRNINEMDTIWAQFQSQPGAWPSWATFWQEPPLLRVQLFPVPGGDGTLNIWYYRYPNFLNVNNQSATLDIPAGYEPLVRQYAKFMALRRMADPRWSEERDLYEENLSTLIDNSRQYNDAGGQFMPGPFSAGYSDPWY